MFAPLVRVCPRTPNSLSLVFVSRDGSFWRPAIKGGAMMVRGVFSSLGVAAVSLSGLLMLADSAAAQREGEGRREGEARRDEGRREGQAQREGEGRREGEAR